MDMARQITAPAPVPVRAHASSLCLVTLKQGRGAMPTSEELNELVKAVAAAGDRQAFAVLFKHFAPRVKAYLMRAGSPASVAEELAQEAMVKVWRKASSFDPERAQLSTWIFAIARNLRIDRHRHEGEMAADGELRAAESDADSLAGREHEQLADPADPLDEQLGARQREGRVRHALAQLSEEQSMLLRLSFYEEQPHSQIARELRIPLGTVKSRIRLAVSHLRRLLDGFEP
jgi:RNA polymerase sigma-70 factor (ECF subfamily)